MSQSNTKDIVVLYHGNCTDGFSAAWAAWKKFGDAAEYIAMPYKSLPPDGLAGKEVYILDYYFPEEITKQLISKNRKVIGIDHHLTGEAISKMIGEGLFDLNHSGSVLVWQYFYPDKQVPKLLTHVEDMDLWRFNLPNTREVIAFLDSQPNEFEIWNDAVELAENNFEDLLNKGKIIFNYQQIVIDNIYNNAEEVNFKGHQAYAINSPVFISQLGNKLDEKGEIGIVWSENERGIRYSLRSRGDLNVAEIAEQFPQGGGHKNAAGFILDKNLPHPWENKNEK
jgi:uncharacterized protein